MKQRSLFTVHCSKQKGFTLVEMLAVVVVFIVIGSIMLSILITSFRTSHKTDTISLVRENGNYALTQMAKTIRDARGLVTPFPCVTPAVVSTITILTPDHDQVTYDCTAPPSPTPATIASNSATILDTTAVSVSSCSFTCTQESKSELPIITINFSLRQPGATPSGAFGEQSISDIPFRTSVVMRNITR